MDVSLDVSLEELAIPLHGGIFEGHVTATAAVQPIDARKFHICGMEIQSLRAVAER
jgi:hypothetical protein